MKRNFVLVCAVAFMVSMSSSIVAQISHGGIPRMNHSKAAVERVWTPKVDNELYLSQDMTNTDKGTPLRVGVVQPVNVNNTEHGTVTIAADGSRLWRVALHSPEATFMSVHFSSFSMPEGAEVFFYDASGDFVLGRFVASDVQEDGTFYTQSIPGDEVVVEYYEPASVAGMGSLVIDQVTHGYKDLFGVMLPDTWEQVKGGLGTAEGSCHINAVCYDSLWDNQIRATVAIELTAGGYAFMCTGTLINNTAQDHKPYVLTAYHCQDLDQYGGLSRMTFYFKYQTSTCTGTTGPASKSVTGGTIRAKYSYNGGSDFCLVQISKTIPDTYEPYYCGWDRSNVAQVQSGCCIHHPGGDLKKISIPRSITRGTSSMDKFYKVYWLTGSDNKGVTEQGSSGSGLFNSDGRIIGQLYGGTSACDYMGGEDYYGRVYSSWTGNGSNDSRLSNWLDPLGTGVEVLDGSNYDDTSVDINNVAELPTMNLYPNPCHGTVNFNVPDLGMANYKIYDLAGHCVKEGRTVLTSTVQSINLGNLSSGAYRVVLHTSSNSYSQTLIVR